MKVIAQSHTESHYRERCRYLVEMTVEEIAYVAGFERARELEAKDEANAEVRPGLEIKVADSWQLLKQLRRSQDQLKAARETLAGIVALLGPLPQLIYPVLEGQPDAAQQDS